MEYKIEREPVSCHAKIFKSETGLNLIVYMKTSGTWHLYTPSEMNSNQPVHIDIELPEGWQKDGALQTPPTILSGGSEIYDGKQLDFEQNINPLSARRYVPSQYPVPGKIPKLNTRTKQTVWYIKSFSLF